MFQFQDCAGWEPELTGLYLQLDDGVAGEYTKIEKNTVEILHAAMNQWIKGYWSDDNQPSVCKATSYESGEEGESWYFKILFDADGGYGIDWETAGTEEYTC